MYGSTKIFILLLIESGAIDSNIGGKGGRERGIIFRKGGIEEGNSRMGDIEEEEEEEEAAADVSSGLKN